MVIIIVILINHRGNVAGNLPRHSSHQPGPRAPSVRSNLIMMTTMMMMMMMLMLMMMLMMMMTMTMTIHMVFATNLEGADPFCL